MDFGTIPGVGEKTAVVLAELDSAKRALTDGDVAALAQAPGLTEGRAAAIVRSATRRDHDDPGGLLTTNRASEIYHDALGLLQTRTVTTYAEKRLETLFPTGSTPRIEEVRAFAADATGLNLGPDMFVALSGVKPLADPTPHHVRERCITTAGARRYAATKEAFPELSIEVVEDGHSIAELARSYSTVVVLDRSFVGIDVDGDMHVLPDATERTDEVVPKRLLVFFAANREALEAAAAIHEMAELDPPCGLAALRDVLSRLMDDGAVLGDDELEHLSNAADDFDTAVSTVGSITNDHLRDVIREHDVTIEGTDFLSLVEQGAHVDFLPSRELEDEFDETLSAAYDHLVESLSLRPGEADLTERVFPDNPSSPLNHDKETVGRFRTELKAARDHRAAKLKAGLAADLGNLRDPVKTLVRNAFELDVRLAVSRFARGFDRVFPGFTGAAEDGGTGSFAVEAGHSPLLDMGFPGVDPVDYEMSGVTLLSGVNNGGRTSTLGLVELVVVLAHMGLPVSTESVRLSWFSELHYYARSQGTLDADAFESTLCGFTALTDDVADCPVLVDELESITEPGASAKIIVGILEELAEQGAAAVFVSHLTGGIHEAADVSVAIDGIETIGLEDGELVINRSPMRGHLARSIPELVVEKLADENGTGFYGRLLERSD